MPQIETTHQHVGSVITPHGVVEFAHVENVNTAEATDEQAAYLSGVPGYALAGAEKIPAAVVDEIDLTTPRSKRK